jgi:3-dehydroquinate synthase
MPVIRVTSSSGPYSVTITPGAIGRLGALARRAVRGRTAVVVTDVHVARLWGRAALDSLADAGFSGRMAVLPAGEETKAPRFLESLWSELAEAKAGRDAVVVALGGGVVGDLAGFAAATWNRGIDLVQVPTTLLAMVDASVGGKTGINLPAGKNLAGAFHQPRLVVADLDTLKTLPEREYRAGLAEVVKYGMIGDAGLFGFLEKRRDAVVAREPGLMAEVVARCVAHKARVVARDEREAGLRMVLNLGHTFGHAIEAATRYRRYLHGEAVAIGLCAAGVLSGDRALEGRVRALVTGLGLPDRAKGLDPRKLRVLAGSDKKVRAGRIRYVVPVRIGLARVGGMVSARLESEAWEAAVRGTRV